MLMQGTIPTLEWSPQEIINPITYISITLLKRPNAAKSKVHETNMVGPPTCLRIQPNVVQEPAPLNSS